MFLMGSVIFLGTLGIIAKTIPVGAESQRSTESTGEYYITIYDDGSKTTLRSRATTPGEVLEQAKVI